MNGEIRKIIKRDALYPPALRAYERMPDVLYVKGELPSPSCKSVAIVGARGCSNYGKQEALRFARSLARAGVQVISGMARGIDSWAHIGALEEGGKTFAVLGSGVDVCYPPSHAHLYLRLCEEGGVLSEQEPGAPALPHHFPLRNRIISALSDLVLVVEARKKSGSLITVMYALEQGKTVYAIPGKNGDALSEGCNQLIAEGAGAAVSPEVLLEELGLCPKSGAGKKNARRELPALWRKDPLFCRVWKSLSIEEKDLDTLCAQSRTSVAELSSVLLQLRLEGLVEELPGPYYRRA